MNHILRFSLFWFCNRSVTTKGTSNIGELWMLLINFTCILLDVKESLSKVSVEKIIKNTYFLSEVFSKHLRNIFIRGYSSFVLLLCFTNPLEIALVSCFEALSAVFFQICFLLQMHKNEFYPLYPAFIQFH